VVPIFSFAYCGLGLILIALSVHQCDLWSKAYHMKLLELLDEFFDYSETFRFKCFSFIPNKVVSELEFRIFHNIFCEAYKIQRKAFAYDEYVDKVFEKFVMEIVEIRPWDWLLVCMLFTLNIIRMAAAINFGKKCEEYDYACKNNGLSYIFAMGGLALFVLTLLLAFYSRYLELKIMRSKNIHDIDGYYNYLHVSNLVVVVSSGRCSYCSLSLLCFDWLIRFVSFLSVAVAAPSVAVLRFSSLFLLVSVFPSLFFI
jgi:hypothetical protein